MAASSTTQQLNLILILIIPFISYALGCYTSIINFGDSISDTGNIAAVAKRSGGTPHFCLPPYGETYFHHPTGRCSDGRLIVDFIAQALGLPLVAPYVGDGQMDLEKGANLAFAGATALNSSFLEDIGIYSVYPNISLRAQLNLFKTLLPRVCSTSSECNEYLGNSLILMGEIGGNDYNYAFFLGKSLGEIQDLVPIVVDEIVMGIQELINMGAKTLLVPGNFPIGCIPEYLTLFQSTDKEQYDPSTGCLKWLNEFSEYHNKHLQMKLDQLRMSYPHANIIYADYYNAALRLYESPKQFGFYGKILNACCGDGGPYNYNTSRGCGGPSVPACDDPSMFISWDGIHFTESGYKSMFQNLFNGGLTNPRFDSICSIVSSNGKKPLILGAVANILSYMVHKIFA